MQAPLITVFTPTFNRSSYLVRLYQSLEKQTFTSFEWLILDDGSEDDTAEVVMRLQLENNMTIRYVAQANAGKHIAINSGARLAAGELFFIVDSDDILPEGALATIDGHWQALLKTGEEEQYGGLCGLRTYSDGAIIGGGVDYQLLDTSLITYRYRMGYQGDKAEVFRTSILRAYPFPVIAGEKFCTEALVWNRIGKTYKFRFFNTGIYICEYLEGGLSANSFQLRKGSPRYASLYYAELLNTPGVTFVNRMRAAVNFWRFAMYNRQDSFWEKCKLVNRPWSIAMFPIGYFLYCVVQLKHKVG